MEDIPREGEVDGLSGLRQRTSHGPMETKLAGSVVDNAREKVMKLNAAEESIGKDEKEKTTFGRTPDGRGKTHYSIGDRANLSSLEPTSCHVSIIAPCIPQALIRASRSSSLARC